MGSCSFSDGLTAIPQMGSGFICLNGRLFSLPSNFYRITCLASRFFVPKDHCLTTEKKELINFFFPREDKDINMIGEEKLFTENQRICIYKEYKAKSPRLHSADIYPRKQEQELQRTYRQHGKLECRKFYVKCTQ